MRYIDFLPCSLFPSWEGLGVGFSSLFPVPSSLFPKTRNSVPHQIENRYSCA
ncbi:hypothetical protein [Moorena bouillonii]|uniref:hypothetical protein n=1 Tax=Moorena bouillonii TaxID=207920 RepID=UPI001301860C|nr:hypothetical protein [Moorena bouillonii]